MTELTHLLDRASELDHAPTPVGDDLARARAALRRHRRSRGAIAVGSVAAIALLSAGVAGTTWLDGEPDSGRTVTEERDRDSALVAAQVDGGPYTFGKLPAGWEVQGVDPAAVTIAPIGAKDQNPYSFLGKLVILYDQYPPSGDLSSVNGRDFFSRSGGSDTTTVMVRTRPEEPDGTVYVQYPDSAGWGLDTMIEFLDAVRVNESARPGIG